MMFRATQGRAPGVIDSYIGRLDHALCGPKRVKEDLLAEALDSLVDAAEQYESRGMHRDEAEHRAVREFGEVDRIASGYQTELGLAQGRRTALLVLVVLLAQPLVWGRARLSMAEGTIGDPGPMFALLDRWIGWLGTVATIGALLAMLGCGIGVRYLGARRWLARAAGQFALSVALVFAASGVLMTFLGMRQTQLMSVTGLPWTMVFLVLPMAWVAASARRCLTSAQTEVALS
jgi:hypothetical protein